jgi:hypothetical protein
MSDQVVTPTPSTRDLHPQLAAPSLVYLTGEDFVRLVSWNSLAAVKLTMRMRILTPAAQVVIYPVDQTPNTDRSAKASDSTPIEGWLLGVSVEASTGTPARGQTFAMVKLMRGSAATSIEIATIAADYVTSQQRLSYPGSGVTSSLAGQGFIRTVTGTDPGAGVEVSETVPAGARWKLRSLEAALVTSATVANRDVQVTFDDGTVEFFRGASATNHPASNTFRYTVAPLGDHTAGASVNVPQISTPIDLALLAGYRLKTVTALLDAGDNWGAPIYCVEEWLEAA